MAFTDRWWPARRAFRRRRSAICRASTHPIAMRRALVRAAVINEGHKRDGVPTLAGLSSVSEQLSEHLQVRLVRMPFLRLTFE
jgi:hypothetical protein